MKTPKRGNPGPWATLLREALENLLNANVMGLIDEPEYEAARALLARIDKEG